MVILRLKLLCIVLNILGQVHGLGLGQLLGGLKGGSSSGANDMILCTVRHNVHYATIYDSVLVNKCHPTNTCGSGSGGGYGKGGGGGGCQTVTEKKCTSKIETVYENECSTEKDQSCTTVYDTTYEDKCETEYVRICGGFKPVGGNGGGGGAYYNGIHRSLDVDTENADNDSLDLQTADSMVRRKRSAYQGAGGCTKIPQQKCNKIPNKIPRRQCSTVDKPSCHSTPRQVHKQECNDVPRQQCQSSCSNEVVHKCHKVQKRVPRLIGHRVPQKHCERLNQAGGQQGIRLVGVFGGGAGAGVGPVVPSYGLHGSSVHPSGYF